MAMERGVGGRFFMRGGQRSRKEDMSIGRNGYGADIKRLREFPGNVKR